MYGPAEQLQHIQYRGGRAGVFVPGFIESSSCQIGIFLALNALPKMSTWLIRPAH